MDRRQMLVGMTALGFAGSLNPEAILAQAAPSLTSNSPDTSDRERAGLRGPVRKITTDDRVTEYDVKGNELRLLFKDSKWRLTRTYDAAGHLQKIETRQPDGTKLEENYSYDTEGRLQTIVDSHGRRTSFAYYDVQGLKTTVRSVTPRERQEEGQVALSEEVLFSAAESGFDLTDGGTVTTSYNKSDQPQSVEIKDNEGTVLTRIAREYDSEGRLISEKLIREDPGTGFAKRLWAQVPEEERTPEMLQDIRKHLRAAMGMFGESASRTYTYDSQSRVIKTSFERSTFGVQERTTSYNQQGDVKEEKTTYSKSASSFPAGVEFHFDEGGQLVSDTPESEWPEQPPLPEPTTIRYEYQYDPLGNWTEKKQVLTGATQPPWIQHRVVEYY